jgi:hypothetical protein
MSSLAWNAFDLPFESTRDGITSWSAIQQRGFVTERRVETRTILYLWVCLVPWNIALHGGRSSTLH